MKMEKNIVWLLAPLLLWTSLLWADPSQNLAILDSRNLSQSTPEITLARLRDNLELKVQIPDPLRISEDEIQWGIFRDGVQVQELKGQKKALRLPEATYTIALRIGRFVVRKEVDLYKKQKVTPYFKAEIGRIELFADQQVDWQIQDSAHNQLLFAESNASYIEEIVPAGVYEVRTLNQSVPRSRRLFVTAGQVARADINVPVGQVKLIAIQDNQPLFRPVEWRVFRLENGVRRQIGSYHQHSQGITIPPGYYEAVATHESTVRSRQFWVKENTTNKVVLAMDKK